MLADLKCPADISQTEQGRKAGEERVEERKTTNLPAVREREVQRLNLTTRDTNDPKCFGFHSVKLRKVRGRSTSPERRAALRHAEAKALYVVRSPGGPRKDFA